MTATRTDQQTLLLNASSRLSELEFFEGNYEDSHRWANLALEIDPEDTRAKETRAMAQQKMGQGKNTAMAIAKALGIPVIDPKDTPLRMKDLAGTMVYETDRER